VGCLARDGSGGLVGLLGGEFADLLICWVAGLLGGEFADLRICEFADWLVAGGINPNFILLIASQKFILFEQ